MSTSGKISRPQLKALIKECLIEILQEGIGGGMMMHAGSPDVVLPVSENRRRPVQQSQPHQRRISPLDMPAFPQQRTSAPSNNRPQIPNNALARAVMTESGGNAIMANILADTAMTTLQSQLAGEAPSSARGSRLSQQEQFSGRPDQVFGEEVASKWAALAFADSPDKK